MPLQHLLSDHTNLLERPRARCRLSQLGGYHLSQPSMTQDGMLWFCTCNARRLAGCVPAHDLLRLRVCCVSGRDTMDMGSLRQELQLPHHFITGDNDNDLDEDIMMLGSTPQV